MPRDTGQDTQVVTVKLAADVVAKVDAVAGRDKAGRSGIIRAALAEWLERHSQNPKIDV